MIKRRTCKGCCVMAHGTIFGGWKMAVIFPGRRTGTIITMAFCAVINSAGMIKGCIRKCAEDVADATVFIRRKVIGVGLGIFANRYTTIMTGRTVVCDTRMVEHCTGKAKGDASIVTGATIFIRRKVSWFLFGYCARGTITVTFCTVIYSTGMIKGSVSETRCVMAGATVLIGGRVIWCFFSGANVNKIAIVTGSTVVRDACMRKICRCAE